MAGNSQHPAGSIGGEQARVRILGRVHAPTGPRLRASEVCRRTGLPFSTVHRLLAGAGRLDGVLRRSPDGTYAVGLRSVAAGGRATRSCASLRACRAAGHVRPVRLGRRLRLPDRARRRRGTVHRGDPAAGRRRVRSTAPGSRCAPRPAAQVLLAYAEIRTLTGSATGRTSDLPSDERLHQIMRIRRAGVAVSTVDRPPGGGRPGLRRRRRRSSPSLEMVASPCADRVALARAVRRAAADATAGLRVRLPRPVGTANALPAQWLRPGRSYAQS